MTRTTLCLCVCAALFAPRAFSARPSFMPADVEKALAQKVPGRLVKAPLHETVAEYAKLSGLTIRVDWEALKAAGVGKDTPVLVKFSQITMEKLLDLTLAEISKKDHYLAWYVDEDVIRITSQRRLLSPKRVPPGKTTPATTKPASSSRTQLRKIHFEETGLADVLTFLRDVSGANFHVNWQALKAVEIDKETPVTIRAENISVARALDLVTDQLGAHLGKLDRVYWVVDEGVVMVSTGTTLNRKLRTRVYDVGDLLMVAENFRGPRMDVQVAGAGSGSGRSRGAGSLWKTESERDGPSRKEQRKANEKKLIDIIKTTIGEDMWEPTGKGTIHIFQNRIIISQTLLGFKMMSKVVGKNWILKGR